MACVFLYADSDIRIEQDLLDRMRFLRRRWISIRARYDEPIDVQNDYDFAVPAAGEGADSGRDAQG